ncbi:hypothetical protein [Enterococcus wangshanyuanii]|uniref:Uncharacterized protein n=1 Tax=Enterococcus wangshanyuanii TaxID=2005703 RepID=A0ABQ1PRX3_9ENTE|nr:hypothetical protein [Enterococcus wangshanyuanii]GGD02464.1 hypothetical protein GCM10011573_34860 [Enterococcus wangshanyuanii]
MVEKKETEDKLDDYLSFNKPLDLEDLKNLQKSIPDYDIQIDKTSSEKVKIAKKAKVYNNESDIKKGFLEKLLDIMQNEEEDKRKNRTLITHCLLGYFGFISLFVCLVISQSNTMDTAVVLAVVGGFFANVISLLILLLKYIYSPSKELHDFIIQLFKDRHDDKQDDDCD